MGQGDRARPPIVRVAYYSPLPPERSGIADYSALLLPALRRRMDVEVARRRRPALRRTDVALYHVGNNPQAHGWIVDALRRRPGVVVLHDLVLHHLVAGLTLARGNPSGYIAAMERDGGEEARRLGRGRVPWRRPPALGNRAGAVPAGRCDSRPRHRPRRPLALHRARRARGGLSRTDLAHPARRCAGARSRARPHRGVACHRLVRPRQPRESGSRSCSEPSRSSASSFPRARLDAAGGDRAGIRARPADRGPRPRGRCCQ